MAKYIRHKLNYKSKCNNIARKKIILNDKKLYVSMMLEKLWNILPMTHERAMTPKEAVNIIRSDKHSNINIYTFCNYYSINLIKCKKQHILFNGENIVLYYRYVDDIYHLVGVLFLFFLEGNLFSYTRRFRSKYKRSSYKYKEDIDEFGRVLRLLIEEKGRQIHTRLDDEIICLQELIKDKIGRLIVSHTFFEDSDTGKVSIIFNTEEGEMELSDEDAWKEFENMNKVVGDLFRENLSKFKIIDRVMVV